MAEERRFFETKQIDLATADKAYKVYKVRGGEVINIKAKDDNSGIIYIGDVNVSTTKGYPLKKGESFEIVYRDDLPVDWFIEVYAVAATAGDDVCYMVLPPP